jgi:hypothetical protein
VAGNPGRLWKHRGGSRRRCWRMGRNLERRRGMAEPLVVRSGIAGRGRQRAGGWDEPGVGCGGQLGSSGRSTRARWGGRERPTGWRPRGRHARSDGPDVASVPGSERVSVRRRRCCDAESGTQPRVGLGAESRTGERRDG